jgi:Type I phosphodiesterase / nucleotide pyrophosphatase
VPGPARGSHGVVMCASARQGGGLPPVPEPTAPRLPDYGGACITNVVPALLGPVRRAPVPWPTWMPAPARDADQVVLLVLDGLGWLQLQERRRLAAVMTSMDGGPIDSVAPTTTASALTSISTGTAPGEHGVVGYRIDVHGEILNVLRWSTPAGDARRRVPPHEFQTVPPFLGSAVPVVNRAELDGSGFSLAHLAGTRHVGWRVPSTLVVEVARLLTRRERFVYAYYDGLDKVAHEYGLGPVYDAELAFVDRLVGDLLSVMPNGAALVLTADHGQVDVGDQLVRLDPSVTGLVRLQSGEARFRWLHSLPGAADELLAAARELYGRDAWVVTRDQIRDEGWFGPRLEPRAASRLGDVALVSRARVSFDDPADSGPIRLISRHGALTPDELVVPLLGARA